MAASDEGKKASENLKDAANEARHRTEANAEKEKRDVAGDSMTATEKAGSKINEMKNDAQAGMDKAKQDARNK